MADQEEEDLKMALKLSMQQNESPEPKRSKPMETTPVGGEADSSEESPEVKNRRLQRELMAAAAEKRRAATKNAAEKQMDSAKGAVKNVEKMKDAEIRGLEVEKKGKDVNLEKAEVKSESLGDLLSGDEANKLFWMIFGTRVSKDVLAQWSNQGIRFSPDPETSTGLVQHEGGPCGVLAAIQLLLMLSRMVFVDRTVYTDNSESWKSFSSLKNSVYLVAFVLKYLLFSPEESGNFPNMHADMASRRITHNDSVAADFFHHLTEENRSRALVRSMSEILFLCGSNERVVIASLDILHGNSIDSIDGSKDEVLAKALEGLSFESGSDLQKVLRINTCTSQLSAFKKLEAMLPIFRSRMGALLFLIAALLSRGLDNVQQDRDDPSQPLVTAPFGHASQEIVNLLLSGSAAANVFDGKMDLGGGMFVKGISTTVEVGFLTLLESLNFCKVGQYLKCPKWPIWVVGSESHYTVLFALDTKVQEENEFERRETQIRRAFDAQDQSGGGGFISVEGFHRVIVETVINLPPDKVEHLCSSGFIVWSEFWQALLDLDKSLGGVKDSTGLMGKKVFDLYHFNGIAKSIGNGSLASLGGENPIQRPRLTKLSVSVPPRWTPEEFLADAPVSSDSVKNEPGGVEISIEVSKPQPAQHAPLVDCIRTRWKRAVCNWDGDAPSIV